ncbi:DUF115 domain-containing protein [Paenibacillus sp. ClWae2A]|uniref:motility associated factor glycosyltransferase family protein n=1 Tax=Paenibacillus sp. ClWae2A TaxID=3057177 RepID=UPI0028F62E96|nr:6-hydroxymethylpterin diphosphokinase MptE-like protein [Paenibacillus sp. ClWae2A]MDT9720510.1 DUF115 domain-containing protein [Paenibacillus sp. ClWae2A]
MLEFLDNNINVLSRNSLHWISEPIDKEISFQLHEKDHDKGDLVEVDGSFIYIKNDFDESSKPNPDKKELIFVMGIYSITEIMQLIQTMSKESFLVIIEPGFSFFNYVLSDEDLLFFESSNVILFADDLSNIPVFLDRLFSTSLIFYLKNINFYFTSYYRNHDVDSCISLVREVKGAAKYKTTIYGNSVDDSLIGFRHNMKNIKHIIRSKDVSQIKGIFSNIPAIVVAAGPSLNKNIDYIKQFKNKALIIAVDTIAERLLKEGITPEFICSVERGEMTYSYFYKGKSYPSEVSLVGPLLLYPNIFEEFKNELIIPIRENVGEYAWLKEMLNLADNNSISMGQSCAHVAFGLAEHLGASPIILVGQDLAYGKTQEETHASNTIYDLKPVTTATNVKSITTDGYYDEQVETTEIWNAFRNWFESETFNKKLNVINATEGGAKIHHTVQMNLSEVYEKYCSDSLIDFQEKIRSANNYPVDMDQVFLNLQRELKSFKAIKRKLEEQLSLLLKIKIEADFTEKKLLNVLNNLEKTDVIFNEVMGNMLLRHNLQAMLITTVWNLFEIEQVLTAENLSRNKDVQVNFLETGIVVLTELIEVLESTIIN